VNGHTRLAQRTLSVKQHGSSLASAADSERSQSLYHHVENRINTRSIYSDSKCFKHLQGSLLAYDCTVVHKKP